MYLVLSWEQARTLPDQKYGLKSLVTKKSKIHEGLRKVATDLDKLNLI
jgi:hypothetical protein